MRYRLGPPVFTQNRPRALHELGTNHHQFVYLGLRDRGGMVDAGNGNIRRGCNTPYTAPRATLQVRILPVPNGSERRR